MDDVDHEIGSCRENAEMDLEGLDVNNAKTFVYHPQVTDGFTPKLGQEFLTLDDVYTFYNTYAMHAGFSVRNFNEKKRVGSDENHRKEYVCYKQGKGKLLADMDVKRKRGSTKEGCSARIVVVKRNDLYVVTIIEEDHCHPLSTPQRDLYNFKRDERNELKGHDGDMLNEYLKLEQQKNPSFTFTIDINNEKRIARCFWADATSRRAYRFYGDVVIFDTTYNTNRYGMIFAPLMGVNNHGQTIIFGCAFLSDETIDTFVWLFKCFLEAMPGDAPKMIITDQDPAMTNAISQILPNTFHRYCSWHILTKLSGKFSAYYKDFSNCIWNSETVEEFDSTWVELVEKSGLNANKWLQSMFELMKEDVNYNIYKIYRRNVNNFKVREIHNDKSLDYATCTCKKFESLGILCRHVIAYLNKYHDLDELPTKYILKRWTKTTKSSGVIDDNGVMIKDDKSYLLLRSRLIQHSLDLIDRALTNEEAINILNECLGNADKKIKQIIGNNDSKRNNEMECGGMSVSKSVNMTSTCEHSYIESNQVRARGCDKRLKGGKERALEKTKNPKGRCCHGCGKVGATHDKRNCPVLNNRSGASNDDATQDPSVGDDSDSPTVGASELQ